MMRPVQNRFCRKKTDQRPETGSPVFWGCNSLQCAAIAQIFPIDEKTTAAKRVFARNGGIQA